MSDLIDVKETYLRLILELEEERVPPLRARIAERLRQSGPSVSETVARMERDGLLTLTGDRHLQLTALGRRRATGVVRRHRLAETLLVRVLGLSGRTAQAEAGRWAHVIGPDAEHRLYEFLGRPPASPSGKHIPEPEWTLALSM
jgi:DtxR family transcriptional regulator, Mn-dependent transcriptional regulator